MKKLTLACTVSVVFLFSDISKADANVFFNLAIGLDIPAPIFVVPSPVIYDYYPTFASASLVSISPNVFLSFAIGIPAPVFVVSAPVILVPPVFAFPLPLIIEPAPVLYSPPVVYPAPQIIYPGPKHIHVHSHGLHHVHNKYPVHKRHGFNVRYNRSNHKYHGFEVRHNGGNHKLHGFQARHNGGNHKHHGFSVKQHKGGKGYKGSMRVKNNKAGNKRVARKANHRKH